MSRHEALAARCTSEAELDRVLAWHGAAERVRPGYPLSLVIPDSGRLVRKLVSHGGIAPLRAVELLLDEGVDLATATALAGWNRPEDYRQVVTRLREG